MVDEKIGRVLGALGDAGDPGSLRSRTVIFRCADHGEMGLSHGGLRQKAFNAYEETIHVPLVVSNPVLFPQAGRDRRARLAGRPAADDRDARRRRARRRTRAGRDLTPVLAEQGRRRGGRRCATRARDFGPVTEHPAPAASVQDEIHFTYDDHQAATAMQNVPGQPNRIRAVRTARHKFALYFDPGRQAAPEYEMYDLERDPERGDEPGRPLKRRGRRARPIGLCARSSASGLRA